MDRRKDLIENFKILRESASKEPFKARAYTRVISQLEKRTDPILTIDDLSTIEGLGERLRAKAIIILDQGYVEDTKMLLTGDGRKKTKAIEDFMNIMSIGNVKARSLVEDHGIYNVDDLKSKINEMPSLLNEKQRLGLKYYDHFIKRIPRKEMDKHAKMIRTSIHELDPSIMCEIVGSYRRGAQSSGDIDVLITQNHDRTSCLKEVIDVLRSKNYLVDDFAYGKEKYLGVCKLSHHRTYRRIDILYIKPSQYAFALLYFTGSQDFNIEMRNWALDHCYSLSEHGLKRKDGSEVNMFFANEEAVFEFLRMKYVPPEDRKKGAVQSLECDLIKQ